MLRQPTIFKDLILESDVEEDAHEAQEDSVYEFILNEGPNLSSR